MGALCEGLCLVPLAPSITSKAWIMRLPCMQATVVDTKVINVGTKKDPVKGPGKATGVSSPLGLGRWIGSTWANVSPVYGVTIHQQSSYGLEGSGNPPLEGPGGCTWPLSGGHHSCQSATSGTWGHLDC